MLNDDGSRAEKVRRSIRDEERRILDLLPWLRHRDAIGALLLGVCASWMVALGVLYALGKVPWYVCLFGNAFLASVLHEIEHDLIHFLYFRHRPRVHDAMMLVVWLFRGNVVHGWYRRKLHFQHHRASGHETDVEERLLGLGMPWGVRRLGVTVDGALAFLLSARPLGREVEGFRARELALAAVPVYPVFALVLLSFALHRGLEWLVPGYAPGPWGARALPVVDVLAVAWVLPNYLRQASLSLVSSSVHYYGDVRTVDDETQVLRPFYLWPLQLFCFNFGTTHLLHHYVVDQPFYLRQLVAPAVLPRLRDAGLRFNDLGTFRRANRPAADSMSPEPMTG
jgi:fatty acid desaturase